MDESNNRRVDSNDIAALMIKYYQDLFTSSKPNAHVADLDHIPNVITDHMNAALVAPFRDDEVTEALKQMAPFKALGPDGMPPLFYQHFWGVVNVTNLVLSWLNTCTIPHPINQTFIKLIPKINKKKTLNLSLNIV